VETVLILKFKLTLKFKVPYDVVHPRLVPDPSCSYQFCSFEVTDFRLERTHFKRASAEIDLRVLQIWCGHSLVLVGVQVHMVVNGG
jgi:hypothetical protein